FPDPWFALDPQTTGGRFRKSRAGRVLVERNAAAADATKNVFVVAFDFSRAVFRLRAQPDQLQLFLPHPPYDIVERLDHHARAVLFDGRPRRRLTFVRTPLA